VANSGIASRKKVLSLEHISLSFTNLSALACVSDSQWFLMVMALGFDFNKPPASHLAAPVAAQFQAVLTAIPSGVIWPADNSVPKHHIVWARTGIHA
jgi:hypothetical protein